MNIIFASLFNGGFALACAAVVWVIVFWIILGVYAKTRENVMTKWGVRSIEDAREALLEIGPEAHAVKIMRNWSLWLWVGAAIFIFSALMTVFCKLS